MCCSDCFWTLQGIHDMCCSVCLWILQGIAKHVLLRLLLDIAQCSWIRAAEIIAWHHKTYRAFVADFYPLKSQIYAKLLPLQAIILELSRLARVITDTSTTMNNNIICNTQYIIINNNVYDLHVWSQIRPCTGPRFLSTDPRDVWLWNPNVHV